MVQLLVAQVAINTLTPDAGSALDITATDAGILIPRVDIADLTTIAPVTGGSTESLLVYNTNTTTGKGFYYWDGSDWIPFDRDWKLEGNAGTNPNVNYLGTSDNQPLVFATNDDEQMRLLTNGRLGINATTPQEFLYASGDVVLGAGVDYDGESENIRYRARSVDWFMGAENDSDPDEAYFYIGTTESVDNAQFKISPDSFVNIGSDHGGDPEDILHITRDAEETTTIRLDNRSTSASIYHTSFELWEGSSTTSPTTGQQAFFRHDNGDHILDIGHTKADGVVNFYSGDGSFGPNSDISVTLENDGSVTIQDLLNLNPGSAPSSPIRGDVYYDSSDDKVKVFTGLVWEDLN